MRIIALALACACLLVCSGCGGAGDVETLLRAPQLSGESSALQKALNSHLGSNAMLKYPASGQFLSPFAFGDWDGDGTEEAAILYAADVAGGNVNLAVLEQNGAQGWRVAQTVEGLAAEVETFCFAHLKDDVSLQLIAGYSSAQGDRYLAVYHYDGETLQTVIQQNYTEMLLADLTGKQGTEDLVLALPTEAENAGVTLQLLTTVRGEFRSVQTLALGAGSYNGCAALHAGKGSDEGAYLVMDAWVGSSSLASSIVLYDAASASLQTYYPPGLSDPQRSTLRYDADLLSRDLDGNGTVDIPIEVTDGGTILTPVDKRLRFLLWQDYATKTQGGNSHFGVYDSEYGFFVPLPESMHGMVQLRSNQAGTGWMICNREGTTIYCEFRVMDQEQAEAEEYHRIAYIGNQQLQVRMVTPYYGLDLQDVLEQTRLL